MGNGIKRNKIFSVELILSKIIQYLTLEEKKNFSLLNHKINKIFRESITNINIKILDKNNINIIIKRFPNWAGLAVINYQQIIQRLKMIKDNDGFMHFEKLILKDTDIKDI